MTLTRRAAGPDDLDGLVALYEAYDAAEFGRPEMERADLATMIALDTSERVVVLAGDRLVGHAELAENGEAESAVDPGLPDAAGRHGELLAWLVERAAARGVRRLEHWAGARPDGAARQLSGAGFEHVRTMWTMRRALAGELPVPGWPAAVRVRAFDPDRDAREVWELVMRSFAGRFGSHLRSFEQWAQLTLGPTTDVVCAVEGAHLVAAAVTAVRAGQGYVNQLAVDPDSQGRGLGLALLHEAFQRDAAARRTTTSLVVDGENAGARRLYERAGMTVVEEFRRWEREVDGTAGAG